MMIDFHAVVKTKQKTYRDPVYPLPSFLQQPGSINTNIVHISLITKIPHAALLKPQPLLTDPQPSRNSWQPPICSPIQFCKFISRISHKWNPIVHNLLGLALFTQHNSLKIHPGYRVYQ